MIRTNLLKDVLYNLSTKNPINDQYNKGILVGYISALMATKNLTWNQVVNNWIYPYMPDNYPAWVDEFLKSN